MNVLLRLELLEKNAGNGVKNDLPPVQFARQSTEIQQTEPRKFGNFMQSETSSQDPNAMVTPEQMIRRNYVPDSAASIDGSGGKTPKLNMYDVNKKKVTGQFRGRQPGHSVDYGSGHSSVTAKGLSNNAAARRVS